ncbi:MAG: hypothetical protein JW982_02135 [Spirochaetes bacterium]|nr:hypothetical protein [Spirochaetota bacterium]
MASFYKIDGAKFPDLETLKNSLWPLYESRLSKDEFDKYVSEKAEKIEQ